MEAGRKMLQNSVPRSSMSRLLLGERPLCTLGNHISEYVALNLLLLLAHSKTSRDQRERNRARIS